MEPTTYQLSFFGKGSEYFKIKIINIILCIVTLGLYYPWAKAKTLQYLYSHTTFEEQPFAFTGTGNEMFKGFVKAVLFLIIIDAMIMVPSYYGFTTAAIITTATAYLLILAVIPIAINGSYKYRMAKTYWRGIRFGYTGDRAALTTIFLKGIGLSIITLGIYIPWFIMNLRTYIISNIKIGNASFNYKGSGNEYLWLYIKGYFLSIFTFGIYYFWWKKDLFEFLFNNLEITQGEKKVDFRSTATGGGFALLIISNLFIIIFTLGLGFAWAEIRRLQYVANNIIITGNYSFEELQQSQLDYSDATGDDLVDLFDLGFTI